MTGMLQVAVPTCLRNRMLVSFQTLTLDASKMAVRNRKERSEARAKAASARRAARQAREGEKKGPIPGIPVRVSGWQHGGGDGVASGVAHDDAEADDSGKTPLIEKEHVQAVYDTIAPHWSHTRYKPWPKVADFLSRLPPNSLIADAGCGNGKYLGCDAAGGCLLGSDASVNLVKICRERLPQAQVVAADCLRLPFRSGVFDAAVSIAVLHHLSSEARRLKALSELARLLRPGGQVLIYAWAIEQEEGSRRSFAQQDVLVPWHLGDQHTQQAVAWDCGGDRSSLWHEEDKNEDKADLVGIGTERDVTNVEVGTSIPGVILPQKNKDKDQEKDKDKDQEKDQDQDQARIGPIAFPKEMGRSCTPDAQDVSASREPVRTVAAMHEDSSAQNGVVPDGEQGKKYRGDGDTVEPDRIHLGSATVDQAYSANCVTSAPAPQGASHGVRLDPVPGAGGSVVYQRYCHVYMEGELEKLIQGVEGLGVLDSYYDKSNWCVLAQKY